MENFIEIYFSLGFSNSEILSFLALNNQIVISIRTLKRRLASLNLYRRKNYTAIVDVALFILEQVLQPGFHSGYRWMHLKCIRQGFTVSRDMVADLMSVIDPDGVARRKKKRLRRRKYDGRGPNYIWHVDSYDKLKRYGLCVNGAIDGFSRFIPYLRVTNSSSNPRITAASFIEAVEKNGSCPSKMRGDKGTENRCVEQMMNFLTDNEYSFLYGTSTSNQRIEMFWGHLRRHCGQMWMDRMQILVEEELFDGDMLDKNLVQHVFMGLFQDDIDEAVELWNLHTIRHSKNAVSPYGKPCVMYMLPDLYETRDYKVQVNQAALDICKEECTFEETGASDADFAELFNLLMQNNNLERTKDFDSAKEQYIELRQLALHALEDH